MSGKQPLFRETQKAPSGAYTLSLRCRIYASILHLLTDSTGDVYSTARCQSVKAPHNKFKGQTGTREEMQALLESMEFQEVGASCLDASVVKVP